MFKMLPALRDKLLGWGNTAFEWGDHLTFGALTILRSAERSFSVGRAPEAAASMAYYALFSLFPLLLALVSIGGYFLGRQQTYSKLTEFVHLTFPVSSDVIIATIGDVLKRRGTSGILGLIGLVWAASAIFNILFRNINRAWMHAKPLNFLKSRLVAVGSVFALGLLLILNLFAGAVLDLVPAIGGSIGGGEEFFESPLWLFLSAVLPVISTFIIFTGLYRWVPNTIVLWREAMWGALLVAVGLELTTRVFTLYLSTEWATYNLVYGSLGAIVALLSWIYLNSLIILFGAYLCAAIAQHTRLATRTVAPPPDDKSEA